MHVPLQLHTRALTLPHYVSTAQQLHAVALRLLRPELPLTLRLIGIRRADSSARALFARCREQLAALPGQR